MVKKKMEIYTYFILILLAWGFFGKYALKFINLSFIFLKEKVTLVQGIGIVLAVIAGVLLSI